MKQERWHKLCVWAMQEPDPKRLMDVITKLNALLTKEERVIGEELKQHSSEEVSRTKPAKLRKTAGLKKKKPESQMRSPDQNDQRKAS